MLDTLTTLDNIRIIMQSLDNQVFKKAMSLYPSGVVIVTTFNDQGDKCGFTASAFTSLSLEPPLVLVCLANTADCFNSFKKSKQFSINVIGEQQQELAFKFATKGADKFEGDEFAISELTGLPIITDCVCSLECETRYTYPGGDHEILVGEVQHARINNTNPSIWYEGSFRNIANN